jgi:hypothetical protein
MSTRIVAIERTGAPTAGMADLRVVSVRDDPAATLQVHGRVEVWGIADDGARHLLFSYYSDELAFAPGELEQLLVGVPPEVARGRAMWLRQRRDAAYLRA